MTKVDKLVDDALSDAAIKQYLGERGKLKLSFWQGLVGAIVAFAAIGDFVITALHWHG